MENAKLLIIAGNDSEYRDWCVAHDIKRRHDERVVFYIDTPLRITQFSGQDVYIEMIGTAFKRGSIIEQARIHFPTEMFVAETTYESKEPLKVKRVRIQFSDTTWEIPAWVIARHRTQYFANKDLEDSGRVLAVVNIREEYEYAMSDDDQLIDWASNNMDWKDVADYARRVNEPTLVDRDAEWTNAEKRIVEISL